MHIFINSLKIIIYCSASEGTREDKFKLFVTSTVAAGVGYIGARYIQYVESSNGAHNSNMIPA